MTEKVRKFRINKRTLMRDLIKHFADTLGDKNFMTFLKIKRPDNISIKINT